MSAENFISVVEGWTGALEFILKADDVAVDLTGITSVVVEAKKLDGSTITLTGTTAVSDAANGKVQFSPAAADLKEVNSPYLVRFKVTDGSSKITYFPSGEAFTWKIRK